MFSSNIGSEHFVGLAGAGASSGIVLVLYEWFVSSKERLPLSLPSRCVFVFVVRLKEQEQLNFCLLFFERGGPKRGLGERGNFFHLLIAFCFRQQMWGFF